MKTKIVNLTPSFRTTDEEFESVKKIYRKVKAFERWLKSNLPEGIKGQYSFCDVGESCIRVFIYLNKEDEDSVISLLKWIKVLKGKRFTAEKFFREKEGYFSYKMQREYNNYHSFIILVENGANIDGCVIKKKRKMQTIYKTDCENETVKF